MPDITKQLRSLPPQEQIKAIVKSPDALSLVRSLPPEELLLTIKQVGLNDSLELIELLSPDQLKSIFDLDVWHFDSVDNEKLATWVSALEAANPEVALAQMGEIDFEFLTKMLRDCSTIHDLLENDDPVIESELFLITTDRHFLVTFKDDEEHEIQSRFLRRYLEDLMGKDFMQAARLIESARSETEAMLHEDMLRLRDGRMQDLGFLPFGETLSILSFVDVDKVKESSHIPPATNETEKSLRWHYSLPSLNGLPFLREALTGLSHTTLEDSWNYIVTAANRVHMAQHGNYSDADAVNESARYTLNFIEMALSYLSGGELAKAKSAYLAHAPQDLFKIGHSLVLRLRRDFQKLSKHPAFSLAQSSMARLDSPLREVVSGVMQVEPLFFTGLTDPKRVDFRTFENVREVAQASAAIAEAAFRLAFLKAMGFEEQGIAGKDASAFGLLLGTYFAQAILGQASFDALSKEQFQSFFEHLERSESGLRLRDADKKTCVELAQQRAESLVGLVGVRTIQDAHSRAANYAQIVLGQIESELSQITDKTPDAKFVQSVMIK